MRPLSGAGLHKCIIKKKRYWNYFLSQFKTLIACCDLLTVGCILLQIVLHYPIAVGALVLWMVRTLTPVKVWSASWSERTKTKVPHVNLCAPWGWQVAAHSSTRRWHTSPWSRLGSPRGNHQECGDTSVTGDPVYWGFLTFYSHTFEEVPHLRA